MNSKTTGVWLVIAAGLAGFIFVYQHYFANMVSAPSTILPHMRAEAVTSIQVIPAGKKEISASLTNNDWLLTSPVLYPAQSTAVEALLDTLQKLTPALKISAAELQESKNSEADYGFVSPQATLFINTPNDQWQLLVGNKTAPGNQVYLSVVGSDGAYVADSAWLNLIPQSADVWRDTSLVSAGQAFDWIIITNGPNAIELHVDPATHLWRMIRPLPARADSDRITEALQRLQSAQVTQFITDFAPGADLTSYGLQPPDYSIWFGLGTNFESAVDIGKNPANDSTQVYARREGWNTVFTTAQDPLASWTGTVDDFRDRNLLEVTAPVAEIDVTGPNHFVLQEGSGTNDWKIAGEKFPADAAKVMGFIQTLAGLQIERFVKNVVTKPDLQTYGLTSPQYQVTLRSAVSQSATDTNAIIAQLSFGGVISNEVFVRRSDEDFVYAISADDYNKLFSDGSVYEAGWLFRDRHLWSFDMPDVTQVTVRENGQTRILNHDAANKWSLGTATITGASGGNIEKTVQMLSNLYADDWILRNYPDPAQIGITTNSLQITVALRNGDQHTVMFGAPIANSNDALAAVALDGERWAFVFPAAPYVMVMSYLTIPQNGM